MNKKPDISRATSHFPPVDKAKLPPAPERSTDLRVLQTRIGGWALPAFGPTPPAVHAARMAREMADVQDCIAIGNVDDLGRALAGVFVVGLALAESQNISLTAALLAEQEENESSHWVQDSWGQWIRRGDGAVDEADGIASSIAALVAEDLFPIDLALKLLKSRGASQKHAIAYLVAQADVPDSAFHAPRKEDLTPAGRGVDLRFHPFARGMMPKGDVIKAEGVLDIQSRGITS